MRHGRASRPYASFDVATCYRHPDRETGLSCSECGRPICTDCVTFAPVGLRCPDHASVGGQRAPGSAPGRTRMRAPRLRHPRARSHVAVVTRTLIAINVFVYLAELASG